MEDTRKSTNLLPPPAPPAPLPNAVIMMQVPSPRDSLVGKREGKEERRGEERRKEEERGKEEEERKQEEVGGKL